MLCDEDIAVTSAHTAADITAAHTAADIAAAHTTSIAAAQGLANNLATVTVTTSN